MPLTTAQQAEVERLIPYVGTIARTFARGRGRQHAADIHQDALVACCEAVQAWNPLRCPLDKWVGRVVWTRLARLMEYTTRREMEPLFEIEHNVTAPDAKPPVYACIEKLPDALKPVAVASWIEGKSILEIMSATGLPDRKVKLKLKRAKEALLGLLEDSLWGTSHEVG